ncbi:MAG: class I SAM-dependent methyltransferase [Lachnospiraceae bacterium]|nr:class I SAM-dependent methyltransferase [Lachnospiraceae bacterium]
MTEQIGKITLDYKHYPGEDYYCDGVIEDEILDIVKNNSVSEYPRIIEERASWPILYHLSPLRENIVDWIPVDKSMKVLEVGSGCGAITGAFSRKAGSVTCIDLSKKRSMINAYRHLECDNVTIQVGNFKDIEPELPDDYDYIFLIGVFEYGQGYMGTDTPYEDFMAILKKHMKPDGRLVIAIENKFGLKYWAGCKEDHYGTYFSGLEDYPNGGGVRTFTRRGLEKIMRANGIEEYSFYYPYPDYKFTTTVYSDEYLPQVGELSSNLRNFDRDRLQLFDEKNVFDNIIREGAFHEFSNSYALVIGAPLDIKYAKFSNDRAEEYAIRTDILQDMAGNRSVFKLPLSERAKEHIQNIYTAGERLAERFQGGKFKINRCIRREHAIELEYVKGKTLEVLLDECLDRSDEAGFRALIDTYIEAIRYQEDSEINDFDLIFSNIIVEENTGDWIIIDYEWTFPVRISYEKILFRAFYCYLVGSLKRRKLSFDLIKEKLGIEEQNVEQYVTQELEFQHYVTGNRKSMTEIHSAIGMQNIPVLTLENQYQQQMIRSRQKHVQVYADHGNGFSEEDSCFLTDAECMTEASVQKLQNGMAGYEIQMDLEIEKTVKQLRIDPAMETCMVHVKALELDGIKVDYRTNGKQVGKDLYCFATTDPNVMLSISEIAKQGSGAGETLHICMEVLPMAAQMAECMGATANGTTGQTGFVSKIKGLFREK